MTAEDLLHHVFPWEIRAGVERIEAESPEPVEGE
jgi:hypothetical protein